MEVDLDELAEDEEQEVGLVQPFDLVAELELVEEDFPSVGREPGDVVGQIGGDVLLVAQEDSGR